MGNAKDEAKTPAPAANVAPVRPASSDSSPERDDWAARESARQITAEFGSPAAGSEKGDLDPYRAVVEMMDSTLGPHFHGVEDKELTAATLLALAQHSLDHLAASETPQTGKTRQLVDTAVTHAATAYLQSNAGKSMAAKIAAAGHGPKAMAIAKTLHLSALHALATKKRFGGNINLGHGITLQTDVKMQPQHAMFDCIHASLVVQRANLDAKIDFNKSAGHAATEHVDAAYKNGGINAKAEFNATGALKNAQGSANANVDAGNLHAKGNFEKQSGQAAITHADAAFKNGVIDAKSEFNATGSFKNAQVTADANVDAGNLHAKGNFEKQSGQAAVAHADAVYKNSVVNAKSQYDDGKLTADANVDAGNLHAKGNFEKQSGQAAITHADAVYKNGIVNASGNLANDKLTVDSDVDFKGLHAKGEIRTVHVIHVDNAWMTSDYHFDDDGKLHVILPQSAHSSGPLSQKVPVSMNYQPEDKALVLKVGTPRG